MLIPHHKSESNYLCSSLIKGSNSHPFISPYLSWLWLSDSAAVCFCVLVSLTSSTDTKVESDGIKFRSNL